MSDNQDSTSFAEQLNSIEEARDHLDKKAIEWEGYQRDWHDLLQQEQQLLSEVAYVSNGTVSANHACNQLDEFQAETRRMQAIMSEVDEGFANKRRALSQKEEEITEAYYQEQREEMNGQNKSL